MTFRTIGVDLVLRGGPYETGLAKAAASTRTFAQQANVAGAAAEAGFAKAATGAQDAATATQKAEANIAALARRNTDLRALAGEYERIASSAEKGSDKQVAAARLAEVANKKLEASAKAAKQGMTDLGSAARGLAVAGGTLFASGQLADFARDLGATSLSLAVFEKKSQAVFENSSWDIDKWAGANAHSFGLTKNELRAAAANFGDLIKPMGFTAAETAGLTKKTLDLSGALSAWSGGQRSATEVADIFAKAMLGERDSLKGLGISISEADVQARLALKGQKDLTGVALEQAKAVATQELIFEKSKDAQKAWADGSLDAVKKANQLKSFMAEMREEVAERVGPAFRVAAPAIEALGPILAGVGGLSQATGLTLGEMASKAGSAAIPLGLMGVAALGVGYLVTNMNEKVRLGSGELRQFASASTESLVKITAELGRTKGLGIGLDILSVVKQLASTNPEAARRWVTALDEQGAAAGVSATEMRKLHGVLDEVDRANKQFTTDSSKTGGAVEEASKKFEEWARSIGLGGDALSALAGKSEDVGQRIATAVGGAMSATASAFQSNFDVISKLGGAGWDQAATETEKATSRLETAQQGLADLQERLAAKGELSVSEQQQLAKAMEGVATGQAGAAERLADLQQRLAAKTSLSVGEQQQLRKATEAVTDAQRDAAAAAATYGEAQGLAARRFGDLVNQLDPAGQKIAGFYAESITKAETFSAGIRTAIAQGYDPGFVSRLLQAGPEQAAPIIQAIVSDHTGALVQIVNEGEKQLAAQNQMTVEMARLTQLAVASSSDQMVKDLSNAMRIDQAELASGGTAAAETLAKTLGVGYEQVLRIAKEFGITLGDSMKDAGAANDRFVGSLGVLRSELTMSAPLLDGQTDAANHNRDSIKALVQEARDHVALLAAQGMSMDDLRAVFSRHIEDLKGVMRQAGYTEEVIDAYIKTLGVIPSGPITTKLNVDAEQAKRELNDIAGRVKEIMEGDHTVTLGTAFHEASLAASDANTTPPPPPAPNRTAPPPDEPAPPDSAAPSGGYFGYDKAGGVIAFAAGGPLPSYAGGGIPTATRRDGYVVNTPRAVVGEGNPAWPEYVIPTDPQYRPRSEQLWQEAGHKIDMLAGGGRIVDDRPGMTNVDLAALSASQPFGEANISASGGWHAFTSPSGGQYYSQREGFYDAAGTQPVPGYEGRDRSISMGWDRMAMSRPEPVGASMSIDYDRLAEAVGRHVSKGGRGDINVGPIAVYAEDHESVVSLLPRKIYEELYHADVGAD